MTAQNFDFAHELTIAEVEEEGDGAHDEHDEGAGGGAGVGEAGGGAFDLLGERGVEGDADIIAVDVVHAEVVGEFVGEAYGSGGDGVFDLDVEGFEDGFAGLNGGFGPGYNAVR